MSTGLFLVLFKAIIGFGVPIAFCLHQLHCLRRERERDAAKRASHAQAQPEHEPDRLPEQREAA